MTTMTAIHELIYMAQEMEDISHPLGAQGCLGPGLAVTNSLATTNNLAC